MEFATIYRMINTSEIALLEYKAPGSFEETRYEKLHNVIVDSSSEGSIKIAHTIASLIIEKQDQDQMCVLGLATGSSPLSVYRELVRLHKEEGLSFKIDFPVVSHNQAIAFERLTSFQSQVLTSQGVLIRVNSEAASESKMRVVFL